MDRFIGKILKGRYKITRKIGEGGFGSVYEAEDLELEGRKVAVKILSKQAEKSFKRETKALISLGGYEYIVKILDVGEEDEYGYLIMEYLEGGNLESLLKKRKLELDEIFEISLKILEGLKVLEDNKVIHRDLKPSNILFDKAGNPVITDFGIAKSYDVQATLSTGPVGTVHYMAPEIFKSDLPLDHRYDLYSFGVILYEMVTGKRPFEGDSMYQVIQQHLYSNPPKPSKIRKGIPPCLDKIILKLLEKDPNYRFESADEVIEALKRCQAEYSVEIGLFRKLTYKAKELPKAVWVVLIGIALAAGAFTQILKKDSLYFNIPSINYEESLMAPEAILSGKRINIFESPKWNYWKFLFPKKLLLIYNGKDTLRVRITPYDTVKFSVLTIASNKNIDSMYVQVEIDSSTSLIPVYNVTSPKTNILLPCSSHVFVKAYVGRTIEEKSIYVTSNFETLNLTAQQISTMELKERNIPIYIKFKNPYKNIMLCINNKCFGSSEGITKIHADKDKIKIAWKVSSTNWVIYKYIHAKKSILITPPEFKVVQLNFNTEEKFNKIKFKLRNSPTNYKSNWGSVTFMKNIFMQLVPGTYDFILITQEGQKVKKSVKFNGKENKIVIDINL